MIDFSNLEKYRENNRIEAKRALGGLPKSIWETYSAFANTLGGIILLGVVEGADKSLHPVDLPDPGRLIEEFLDLLNRPEKASANILSDQNISVEIVEGCHIIAITVPRAGRQDRPVYIDGNPFTGTYLRNGEGDYRCTKEEVQAMLREAARKSPDMDVLEQTEPQALDPDSIHRYRSRMILRHPEHIWQELETPDFLYKLGALGKGRDGKLHPTAAGLLMFGYEYEIVREFPSYFLDYQDMTVSESGQKKYHQVRRIVSSSGDWSGNLFDFYFRVCRALAPACAVQSLSSAMDLSDISGEDPDLESAEKSSVQEALREALTNCLINADYCGTGGIVIRKGQDSLTFSNPGSFRIRLEDARSGGISDPRNTMLCRMFHLIDIGERTGSGLSNIYRIWKRQGWPSPVIMQHTDPDRTTLSLAVNQPPSSAAVYPDIQKAVLINYLTENVSAGTKELAALLDISPARVRKLLSQMAAEELIIKEGTNRNRTYRLKS